MASAVPRMAATFFPPCIVSFRDLGELSRVYVKIHSAKEVPI
jgi:hypothetical protein